MKMTKVYMIEMNDADTGPQIVGIASSEEKRDRMIDVLRRTTDQKTGAKFEAYPFLVDCLIIQDQPILF